ncbi:MAG: SDR family oxidoreductase [Bernardetiaceae bacterium]|nr:SDR family oxidoreductase [Bernardetiaceae bacterium]
MQINLENKTAFVCGSTQGIGKAIAWGLAEAGAKIVLIARNKDVLAALSAQLPTPLGQSHDFIVADFSLPDMLSEALDGYLVKHSEAHILINNTGGPPPGQLIGASLSSLEQTFQQHVICNQILAQALVPLMQKAHYGRIINIISTSVKQPIPNLGVSNTIRGAVASWAKTLSLELAADGITVNNVLPGFTETARLDAIIQNKEKATGKTQEQVAEDMQKNVPAKRFATPEEVAAAAIFLASPQAAYINGINLPVDGGRTGSL